MGISRTSSAVVRQEPLRPSPVSIAEGRKTRALAYDAAGSGRRAATWITTKDDVNSVLFSNVELLRDRSRDAIRKNPFASNAIASFVSNSIGTGIKLRSQHPDKSVRDAIHTLFNRWIEESDADGQTDFYGQQRLIGRSTMEGGECLVRMRSRLPQDGLSVPLQLQVLEAEHLPIYGGTTSKPVGTNVVRLGIEFKTTGKRERVAYHLYKEHPGAYIFASAASSETTRVPIEDVIHTFDQLRPGQLRGQPHLTQVLIKLQELDKYSDAELTRKQMAAMFAGFIHKADPGSNPVPEDNVEGAIATTSLESGTLQVLLPGENITFSDPKDSGNYVEFARTELRAIAAGIGITYEQLTGDLTGVNYSSIRAGLLEFRRRCEQYQYSVFIHQVLRPIFRRWLREAVLAGALNLPGYAQDPTPYEDARWIPPGWSWVDPLKDVIGKIKAIRAGLGTRTQVVSEQGEDVEQIDRENAADQNRADSLGLVYDTDGRVQGGADTRASLATDSAPTAQNPQQAAQDAQASQAAKDQQLEAALLL